MSNQKIKITGVPPVWEQAEYQSLLDAELNRYRLTAESCKLISHPLEADWLQSVIEHYNQGYRLNPRYRINHGNLANDCYMTKPEIEQQSDIKAIATDIRAKYVARLEGEHKRYQSLLREQLLQAEQEKQQKAAEAARLKVLERIEKEVQACYSPLIIPEDAA